MMKDSAEEQKCGRLRKDMNQSLHKCLLLTTTKAHAFMTERHGVISASGCSAANGRGLKQCKTCENGGEK